MSSQENADLVLQYFAAVDDRQFDVVFGMFAPEYTLHFGGMPAMNADAAALLFGDFIAAFPDIRHTIRDLLVDGDRAAARIEFEGTHQGEFMGIPATGNSISVPAVNIFRFDGGKIAESWISSDSLGMLQQLGAMPAAG
jgi:steroid delta-isomerase-like uncharacterized protein